MNNIGVKTGWPPGMLQDDDRRLSRALANRPGARLHAREAAAAIEQECKKDPSQDVFWLYELTRGEGVFQAARGAHAERIVKQVASDFPESGEPFSIGAGVPAAWLDEAMKLAENYARAWQHDVEGSFLVKKQADNAKAALLEHLAGVAAASATAHLSAYEDAVSTGNEGVKAVAPTRLMSLDEFFAEAKRLNLTAADLVPALRARPEFADCLPDRVAGLPAPRVTRAADPSESDAKVAQREGYDEGWNDCLKAVAADGAQAAEWCDREGGCICGFANIACSNYCTTDLSPTGRAGVAGTPAHSKSEYKRRVAQGDASVLPPNGVAGTHELKKKGGA